jgi:UDP-glucose 4-epimerase
MKILVTGANGLLGRQLVIALSKSHEIVGIVRREISEPVPGVAYIAMDMSQPLQQNLLPDRIDVVIHLAQSSRFREFPEGVSDTFNVNVRATLDLLEYCRVAHGNQFFLASTGGVYEGASQPISEGASLIPPSDIGFYFASKLSAEMLSATFRSVFAVTVLRPFFMYGARQRRDMFIPRLIDNIANGKPIKIDSRGGIRVNPILVDDVALLVDRLVGNQTPPVMNVGGAEVLSIREIANEIGALVAREPIFEVGSEARDVIANISVMRDHLRGVDLTPFRTGLKRMINDRY